MESRLVVVTSLLKEVQYLNLIEFRIDIVNLREITYLVLAPDGQPSQTRLIGSKNKQYKVTIISTKRGQMLPLNLSVIIVGFCHNKCQMQMQHA